MLSRPHIIVATDFTQSSDQALRAAEKLRQLTDGKLHVIHVTPYPDQWDWLSNDVLVNYYPDDYKTKMMASLNDEILIQMNKCGAKGDGEILIGPTVPSILKFVSESRPDLLILGHKEKGSFFHLGGVAAKVMAGAEVPVMIASQELDVFRIAGLIDPYQPEKNIFNVTEELGFLCSSDIEFISVCPDNSYIADQTFPESPTVVLMTDEKKKETKDRMLSSLKNNIDPHTSAKLRTEIAGNGSVEEIVKILYQDEIQLAVMTKHHKSKLEKFFLGSVTKGVLDQWHGNLLVLPA